MTHKTELLRLLRLAWISDHVTADDCKKIDTLLAATAEDVRAVVDEPVGYGNRYLLDELATNRGHYVCIFKVQSNIDDVPLYCHPQRPMVLPERELYSRYLRGVIPENRFEVEAYKDGWNACIDRIAELNK